MISPEIYLFPPNPRHVVYVLFSFWLLSFYYTTCCCSENAALPHGCGTDRTLSKADFALFDCTASLHGYYSDVSRVSSLVLIL
jgi:Xaa-Pro aminopeptidase